MTEDAMSKLHATIAATARDRDLKEKQSRDEQAAKDRQRTEASTIWAARKKELPEIVKDVDAMLKQYGFAGIAPVLVDLKHSDIDRAVINFEHSSHNHSKIMLRSTRSGEFICSIAAVSGDVYSEAIPIGELTTDKLKAALANAVSECLTGSWAPRSERPAKPSDASQQ